MKKNAIILAAGKSNRFAPFTYERPKGLFKVKGEVLIERQIEQLKEAGVTEIYVVIGYMKEKFFYLEQKYGVKLLVNNTFAQKGNIYSLYVAKEYLKNSYICCADHYFVKNPFIEDNENNISYRATTFIKRKFREFAVNYSDADVITDCDVGGENKTAMVGHAYFNEEFSKKFRKLMIDEINDFGVSSMFWEEFYTKHQKELTLYRKHFDYDDVWEFDDIDDLRKFDSEFLVNVDSHIITNICNTIKCNPNDIREISVIQAGLTNVSFRFSSKGIRYVYRHPGGTAGNLINREAELFAQFSAKEIGLDNSVIHMDPTGWKISYYVEDMIDCDFRKYPDQLTKGMSYLRKIHNVKIDEKVKIFDDVQEGKKLMTIACASKGNLFDEFADMIKKVEILDKLVKDDERKQELEKVLCHNDIYEPNYLVDKDNEMYLIDWEYAGLNNHLNDISCIFCRYDFTDEEIERYLKEYYGRDLAPEEHRMAIAYIAICAFYWFCWGLYKGSVGDDDGFFFLPAYRNFNRFIDKSIMLYQ